jgi:X-X-X-Leu-X-X-Gly heptad repeat protein
VTLHAGSATLHDGSATLHDGSAILHGGSATVHALQESIVILQRVSASLAGMKCQGAESKCGSAARDWESAEVSAVWSLRGRVQGRNLGQVKASFLLPWEVLRERPPSAASPVFRFP